MNHGKTIVVTGGAGFVGARLALGFKAHYENARVIALDNLKRRGSELNLSRLASGGVEFVHGDVRNPADLPALNRLDLLVECSAEPSVLAGYDSSPRYVLDSNLAGAINCLEWARCQGAALIFLSTSRVYPIESLGKLVLVEEETRLDLDPVQSLPGVGFQGISETFPMEGARSLYGATKYAAELLITEYRDMYGIKAAVNRCGVIAGPGQMGRVDQGILALWVARHVYGGALSYIGFGGKGKQVRDMLHVDDLLDLLLIQADRIEQADGTACNVGGGRTGSVSLCELTRICQEATGNKIALTSVAENRPADIPLYITDNTRIMERYPWKPTRTVPSIVEDTTRWIADNKELLRPVFCS